MVLDKNNNLFPEACAVNIKSAKGYVDLSTFTNIYGTPSSIKWTKSAKQTASGILYNHVVSLLYPGLSDTDFTTFHELLRDKYEVQIQLINGDVYGLNSNLYPFKLTYKFIQAKGIYLEFKGVTPLVQQYINNVILEGLPFILTFSL